MSFTPESEVRVKELEESDWELLGVLEYKGNRDRFEVPEGMETDFASVPRVFVWFLPRYGRYTKAAILHDYLWREAVPAGELTLAQADGIFRRAMWELGVPFLRRWMMWGAVRIGALVKPGGRKGWLRDSWRVIPLLLLALPIVGPPALVILVALTVFYLVELLVYVPLKLFGRKARAPQDPAAKDVNAPELELKLA
jgi:Protein of unknown function (DUF1353)